MFSAFGVGAIKSNLVIHGAEQNQDQISRQSSRYFDQYAFAVNLGGIIGIAIIPYLHSILDPSYYYILYLVAVVMILMSALIFFIGWRYYLHVPSNETVIFRCLPVLFNACRTWFAFKRNQSKRKEPEMLMRSRRCTTSRTVEVEESIIEQESSPSILDFAKKSRGGAFHNRHVQEVKAVRRAFLVFTLLIPFWLAYNQVG